MISKEQKKSNTELNKKYKFIIENVINNINSKYSKFYNNDIFVEGEDHIITTLDQSRVDKIGHIFNYTINEPSSFKKKYDLENVRSFIKLWSRPVIKPEGNRKSMLGGFITLTPSLDAEYALYDPEWREYYIEYACGVPGYFKSNPDWSLKGDLETETKYTAESAVELFIKFLKKHDKLLKMYVVKELEK